MLGAGRAALRMGDAAAALTFFGRADEVSPRDARVKAGMASTLIQLGQPQTALSLFAEAVALGAPEAEILADRGLAYDMTGDPRRAQQDYVAAMRRRDAPELRRRLALSLAISGHRDAALHMIDPQLRRNDRSAWRTQAFVLALTGDAAGAGRTASGQMGPGGAEQMAPFFARLHALSPAQKAMAVHLGRFPSDGRARVETARVDISPDPAALALAGAPAPARARTEAAPPRTTAVRQSDRWDPRDPNGRRSSRPSRRLAPPVTRPSQPAPRTEVAEVNTRWAGSPYPQSASAPPSSPPADAATLPAPAAQAPAVSPVSIPASTPAQPPVSNNETALADLAPSGSSALAQPEALSGPASGTPSLADIAALVNALPEEPRPQTVAAAPPPVAARTSEPVRVASARTTERRSARPAPPPNPSRHWVQIAGGIERASLPREFARLRGARARSAWPPQRLYRAAAHHQPPAGRSLPQRPRSAGLRQPARPPRSRGLCLDKRRRPGDRAPRRAMTPAPFASDPARSRGRLHREEKSTSRGPRDAFQRDRDRIIHSVPFRRLRHKTQVFVAPDGDHFRVRLTHSLEVAQIGRTVARALGLNEDLTEALCLAHDIGHPPFGHAGEEALQAAMAGAGGFDHNAHTIRLLTRLERPYPNFPGLNLSWETLEGLAKHNGPVADPPWALAEADAEFALDLASWPSLEAQVAALADDIAYDNHDIDDGLRAGLFALEELLEVPLVAELWQAARARHPDVDERRLVPELVRDQIGAMVNDLLDETRRRVRRRREPRRGARAQVGPLAAFSDAMRGQERELKAFLHARMYDSPRVKAVKDEAQSVLAALFAAYRDDPQRLPPEWRPAAADEVTVARAIGDFIAGMTDRYAIRRHEELVGPVGLPEGF